MRVGDVTFHHYASAEHVPDESQPSELGEDATGEASSETPGTVLVAEESMPADDYYQVGTVPRHPSSFVSASKA